MVVMGWFTLQYEQHHSPPSLPSFIMVQYRWNAFVYTLANVHLRPYRKLEKGTILTAFHIRYCISFR